MQDRFLEFGDEFIRGEEDVVETEKREFFVLPHIDLRPLQLPKSVLSEDNIAVQREIDDINKKATLNLFRNQNKAARKRYQEIIRLIPRGGYASDDAILPRTYCNLAKAEVSLGCYDDAICHYEDAITHYSRCDVRCLEMSLRGAISAMGQKGDYEAVIDLSSQCLAEFSREPSVAVWANRFMAFAYSEMHRYVDAVNALGRIMVVAHRYNNLCVPYRDVEEMLKNLTPLADRELEARRREFEVHSSERAVRVSIVENVRKHLKYNIFEGNSKAQIAYLNGLYFLKIDEKAEAISAFMTAVKECKWDDKSSIYAYYAMGNVYYNDNKLMEAWDMFSEAITTGGEERLLADSYCYRAKILCAHGRYRSAVVDFKHALAIYQNVLHDDERAVTQNLHIANAYLKLNNEQSAIKYYRDSVDNYRDVTSEDNVRCGMHYANYQHEHGDIDGAIATLNTACAMSKQLKKALLTDEILGMMSRWDGERHDDK